MKNFTSNPVKFLSVVIVSGTILLMSCADSICPTYIDALAKNKSVQGKEYQARKKFTNTQDINYEYNNINLIKKTESTTI